ncbi:toxin-antitoxin system, antitoxin component [Capnocytophaga sp. 051621]|jgi:hypothetical protein|uniref:Toxin-antitoxin system, antitoxin component n=1 Tax=Capnocytophaga periodontitidis TaxID=2795027 RepID=A0ABS0SN88_9FLAO|nr:MULTISPECIES: toxin-antitoxin system, antitoxin component [Capnocytophaga]MBI1647211.1 toxin-antitoxin system, antitoxin component [Capnocytophaga periodontitidis]
MYTNTITFKENLPFQQYQMIMNFLDNMGIEVVEPKEQDFYYELSLQDLEKLKRAEQQSKEGKTISMDDLLSKLKAKYGN